MTALELYIFLESNKIEIHAYHKDKYVYTLEDYLDKDRDDWKIIALIDFYLLQDFCELLGNFYFNNVSDSAIIGLRYGYIAVDLLNIIDYFGINPKGVLLKDLIV